MPNVDVRDIKNNKVEEMSLSDRVFTGEVRPDIMHTVVTMQLANRRRGTASTKNRAEVSGGGRKPWRQKGTGRARAGSNTSPLWKRGGAAFGPRPRDYSYSVPKKIRKAALRSALSLKLAQDKLLIIKGLSLEQIKTREIVNVMENLNVESGLLIIKGENEVIEKSARNIPGLKVLRSAGLNVYDLLRYEKVLILQEAVPTIEGVLSR